MLPNLKFNINWIPKFAKDIVRKRLSKQIFINWVQQYIKRQSVTEARRDLRGSEVWRPYARNQLATKNWQLGLGQRHPWVHEDDLLKGQQEKKTQGYQRLRSWCGVGLLSRHSLSESVPTIPLHARGYRMETWGQTWEEVWSLVFDSMVDHCCG